MGDIEAHINSSEIRKEFANAVFLNDVQSKNDPENEPYLSKYKAREVWTAMLKKLTDLSETSQAANDKLFSMICSVRIKLGTNFTETEELSCGEEHLQLVVQQLGTRRLDRNFSAILQSALNQLGILYTGRDNNEKALRALEDSVSLYVEYKCNFDNPPCGVDESFEEVNCTDSELIRKRNVAFEDAHTHTLFYLAQVHRRLGNNEKSAQYCQSTLKRQLEVQRYQHCEWAMNAASLSQYYMVQNRFRLARHCLASAQYILEELRAKPEKLTIPASLELGEDEAKDTDNFLRSWADLYRCWIKYGIALLEYSYQQKLRVDARPPADGVCINCGLSTLHVDNSHNADVNNGGTCQCSNQNGDEIKLMLFDLELTKIEEQVACEPALNFEKAREIFLVSIKWVTSAKEYYVLDGHCTDFVAIVQDNSTLFKHLANFETDFERQSRMHKRRLDLLQPLVDQLNPQFYLLIVRQLIYEIAEIYSAMFDAKMAVIERDETPPNKHQVEKINHLIQKSIESYEKYINGLKTSAGKLPEKYGEDDERPAIVAFSAWVDCGRNLLITNRERDLQT
jgi:tetratricopeptide (TPR) repeat protein